MESRSESCGRTASLLRAGEGDLRRRSDPLDLGGLESLESRGATRSLPSNWAVSSAFGSELEAENECSSSWVGGEISLDLFCAPTGAI